MGRYSYEGIVVVVCSRIITELQGLSLQATALYTLWNDAIMPRYRALHLDCLVIKNIVIIGSRVRWKESRDGHVHEAHVAGVHEVRIARVPTI